jgi:hypothetical protein
MGRFTELPHQLDATTRRVHEAEIDENREMPTAVNPSVFADLGYRPFAVPTTAS